MKRIFTLSALLVILSLACSLGANAPAEDQPLETAASTPVTNDAGGAVLLFTIGMHIEPMGETAQGVQSGKGDYHQADFFEKHVEDILAVAGIAEAHGGRMTIQAQSPFTTVAIESGSTILSDLASRGHEIALHFHEDAHLGKNSETLGVKRWCNVMAEEISYITQASGVSGIRYWSGGNLYLKIHEAAQCAGLEVNSDWKNPNLQETPLEFTGVNPWRPSGGTDGVNLAAFIQNDPNGAIIFLPEGKYDQTNFASMRRSDDAGGDAAYFEFLKQSLYASLEAAQAGRVNVFHFTVHPGEFRGDPQHPFEVIEKFLTEVVDPLVASGDVQWATFSQMADAYKAWELANPGVTP